MHYKWYEELADDDKSLRQGDLIVDCPLVLPPENFKNLDEVEIEIKISDAIILTQSCDLVNSKIENILVCPYYNLKAFIEELPEEQNGSKKAKKKIIENMRKGYLPGYHLLNKDEKLEKLNDYQVVDFRNIYSIHIEALKNILKNDKERIRLLPPYREQLSQAFARFFMRVGLPQDFKVEGYY